MAIHEDVWVRLDLNSDRPAFIEPRWKTAGVVVAFALLVAGVLMVSGIVVPRISQFSGGSSTGNTSHDELGRRSGLQLSVTQTFKNTSWVPVAITGMSIGGDGLWLGSVATEDGRPFPLVVPPGSEILLTLGIELADCVTAPEEAAPVLFEVERWWGKTVVSASQEVDFEQWQGSFVSSMCEL